MAMPNYNISKVIIMAIIVLLSLGVTFWIKKGGKLTKNKNTGKLKSILITVSATLSAVIFFVLKAMAEGKAIAKRAKEVARVDDEIKKTTDQMKGIDKKIEDAGNTVKTNMENEKQNDDKKSTTDISNDIDNLLDS